MSSNCQYRNADENLNVRKSRGTIVSHSHFRLRRGREPSRIPYRLKKNPRNSVKLYVEKCVPKSSILKAMLCGYHRCGFFEQHTRSNFTLFPKKCFIMQSFFIVRTRILKQKESHLFCMYAEGKLGN